jgi:glyceraldehyde-3-phosphate dehydrogenase/erythrose-4-phosphate dehydrogenase
MTTKIGINGFGRIGRMVLRAAVQNFNDVEIVGINDLLEPEYLAYMLQYDSVHGRFKGSIAVDGNTLVVNGQRIRLTQERDPAQLKWNEVGADVVIESTGLFLDKDSAGQHLAAGRQKSRHVRAFERRHAHVCVRREPRVLCRASHHQQRQLHHQLRWPPSPKCCTTSGASSAA